MLQQQEQQQYGYNQQHQNMNQFDNDAPPHDDPGRGQQQMNQQQHSVQMQGQYQEQLYHRQHLRQQNHQQCQYQEQQLALEQEQLREEQMLLEQEMLREQQIFQEEQIIREQEEHMRLQEEEEMRRRRQEEQDEQLRLGQDRNIDDVVHMQYQTQLEDYHAQEQEQAGAVVLPADVVHQQYSCNQQIVTPQEQRQQHVVLLMPSQRPSGASVAGYVCGSPLGLVPPVTMHHNLPGGAAVMHHNQHLSDHAVGQQHCSSSAQFMNTTSTVCSPYAGNYPKMAVGSPSGLVLQDTGIDHYLQQEEFAKQQNKQEKLRLQLQQQGYKPAACQGPEEDHSNAGPHNVNSMPQTVSEELFHQQVALQQRLEHELEQQLIEASQNKKSSTSTTSVFPSLDEQLQHQGLQQEEQYQYDFSGSSCAQSVSEKNFPRDGSRGGAGVEVVQQYDLQSGIKTNNYNGAGQVVHDTVLAARTDAVQEAASMIPSPATAMYNDAMYHLQQGDSFMLDSATGAGNENDQNAGGAACNTNPSYAFHDAHQLSTKSTAAPTVPSYNGKMSDPDTKDILVNENKKMAHENTTTTAGAFFANQSRMGGSSGDTSSCETAENFDPVWVPPQGGFNGREESENHGNPAVQNNEDHEAVSKKNQQQHEQNVYSNQKQSNTINHKAAQQEKYNYASSSNLYHSFTKNHPRATSYASSTTSHQNYKATSSTTSTGFYNSYSEVVKFGKNKHNAGSNITSGSTTQVNLQGNSNFGSRASVSASSKKTKTTTTASVDPFAALTMQFSDAVQENVERCKKEREERAAGNVGGQVVEKELDHKSLLTQLLNDLDEDCDEQL
ncbi:unnamed protein product [Amoebophrya sp. A120]|nr:unnamed protein product [Amoebophrya sp. A120]|eukprot:GSA120T00010321001.1